VRGQALDFKAGGPLAVSYQVIDLDGEVAAGAFKVFGLNLGSQSRAQAARTGLQFVERVTLKPGRYELRLVAEQRGGSIGSVLTTIEAAAFDESLAISGVALASRQANEVPLVGDRAIRDVLPADPTALRRFSAAGGLTTYAEVYSERENRSAPVPNAAVVVVTGRITTSAGAVVATGKPQRVTAAPAGKSLLEGFRTDFDLQGVKPGSYVLTLEARAGRNGSKPVTRQIPFTVE